MPVPLVCIRCGMMGFVHNEIIKIIVCIAANFIAKDRNQKGEKIRRATPASRGKPPEEFLKTTHRFCF